MIYIFLWKALCNIFICCIVLFVNDFVNFVVFNIRPIFIFWLLTINRFIKFNWKSITPLTFSRTSIRVPTTKDLEWIIGNAPIKYEQNRPEKRVKLKWISKRTKYVLHWMSSFGDNKFVQFAMMCTCSASCMSSRYYRRLN